MGQWMFMAVALAHVANDLINLARIEDDVVSRFFSWLFAPKARWVLRGPEGGRARFTLYNPEEEDMAFTWKIVDHLLSLGWTLVRGPQR